MGQIPDAPWIRDAELNGWGDDVQPVICPVCGAECEEIYETKEYGEVLGCDQCILTRDAYEWKDQQEEDGRDGEDW